MRKFLAVTTAAAALMFAAGTASAQDATSNTGAATDSMYVTGEGDSMMVMGGGNAEGSRVLRGENYAVPADCPEGSYYMSGENQITACGEGGAAFDVTSPGEGETAAGGAAFPAGSMALRPRESGEQKQSDSGNQADDGDQGDDASGGQGEGNSQSEGGGDASEGGSGSGGNNSGGGSGG